MGLSSRPKRSREGVSRTNWKLPLLPFAESVESAMVQGAGDCCEPTQLLLLYVLFILGFLPTVPKLGSGAYKAYKPDIIRPTTPKKP